MSHDPDVVVNLVWFIGVVWLVRRLLRWWAP